MFSAQGSLSLIAVCQVFILIAYFVVIKLNKKHLEVGQEMLSIHDLKLEQSKAEFDLINREAELREKVLEFHHTVATSKEDFDRISKNLQQRELLLTEKEIKKSVIKNRKATTKK